MTITEQAASNSSERPTPPYVAYTTLKNFLTGLRTAGGVPIAIDKSVFGGMSGGYQAQLKSALRFLGLVEKDSTPTAIMHVAVAATEKPEDWHTVINTLLTTYYPTIVAHPLTNTTPDALRKEFEAAFTGNSDLITKAVTFFVHAAKDAGLPLSQRLTERQKGGKRSPRRKPSETPTGGGESTVQTPAIVTTTPQTKARKVSEHQMVLIEIINTYDDMPEEMRNSLLGVVGFIATKKGVIA